MLRRSSGLPSLFVSLLFVVGFASSASADTYQTYVTPKVNGYQIGTWLPNQPTGNFSSAADTARRFCQDMGHSGAQSFTTAIRGSAYTYIVGTNGVGPWNTTGNSNVTMIETVTCFTSSSGIPYTTPTVNGYQVGTIQPNYPTGNFSTPADTARRFCQDQGHTGALSFTTAIRGSAYTYIVGTNGVGAWNTTGNANVTMLETITCFNSTDLTYTTPTVNGYQVGTIQPNQPTGNFSTPADTARRFCQDLGHIGVRSFTTAIRGSAYTYIVGTNGVGAWNTTGNANVTMLETITCITQ
ncbi:hypothetical protein HMI49_41530 [Corallococcus exercitus]|uniref:Uncharacterized protein n=1 Tax=Corallococcus exercitus TaxID=2316736 RepID=A0A7Y4NW29_9BACT|nr:hypothetical protein [Corallococcus exercitus]NOK39665.1 hypothetical protein [Corallococcus exercitus]